MPLTLHHSGGSGQGRKSRQETPSARTRHTPVAGGCWISSDQTLDGWGLSPAALGTFGPARGDARLVGWKQGVVTMRTGLAHQDARDDFDRARRRASWAKLAGWLRGRPASRNRLPLLGEVRTFAGAAGPDVRLEYERMSGLGAGAEAMVPIGQIVGTVEPTTCFDRRFRPTSESPRTRFERIDTGIRAGRGMDPVELYRCDGQYYVLDGRHRIAVARALGERWVTANITDVRLNHPGDPDLSYRIEQRSSPAHEAPPARHAAP